MVLMTRSRTRRVSNRDVYALPLFLFYSRSSLNSQPDAHLTSRRVPHWGSRTIIWHYDLAGARSTVEVPMGVIYTAAEFASPDPRATHDLQPSF